jgi:hypothetical protein
VDLRYLEIMPMQVERVHVVTLVDESESIAATLLDLDGFALIVRLAVDRPDVEPAFASVDFPISIGITSFGAIADLDSPNRR